MEGKVKRQKWKVDSTLAQVSTCALFCHGSTENHGIFSLPLYFRGIFNPKPGASVPLVPSWSKIVQVPMGQAHTWTSKWRKNSFIPFLTHPRPLPIPTKIHAGTRRGGSFLITYYPKAWRKRPRLCLHLCPFCHGSKENHRIISVPLSFRGFFNILLITP